MIEYFPGWDMGVWSLECLLISTVRKVDLSDPLSFGGMGIDGKGGTFDERGISAEEILDADESIWFQFFLVDRMILLWWPLSIIVQLCLCEWNISQGALV